MSDASFDPANLALGPDPLIGKVVAERYRIEKRLGQGGMGAVYKAEHVLIRKRVALKCLHAGLASNPEAVRRFHTEALAATAIGHPNIVDVTDMGRFEDGTFFLVLEYLEGRDWQKDLDAEGPQPPSKVAHIGVQVCAALAAAAAKGIVHRDLKPENIFLIERGTDQNFAKVLDFGISKIQSEATSGTQTGQLMGTPYYMSPEQIRGAKDVTHLADIYSLGVIFFQALSGRVPFDANNLPSLFSMIATETAPRLDAVVRDLPAAWVDLIDAMLHKDPRRRPQSFEDVAMVLRGASAQLPSVSVAAVSMAREGLDATVSGAVEGATGAAAAPSTLPSPRVWRGRRAAVIVAAASVLGAGALTLRPKAELPASDLSEGQRQARGAPANVRVQISTLPPDAELSLDGNPISNPFDGELPTDTVRHELTARREGFEVATRSLAFGQEQRVFIQLAPLASAPSSASSASVPPQATNPPAGRTKATRAPSVQAVHAETTSSSAAPTAPPPAAQTPSAPVEAKPTPLKKVF